jgi:hypothetical protein
VLLELTLGCSVTRRRGGGGRRRRGGEGGRGRRGRSGCDRAVLDAFGSGKKARPRRRNKQGVACPAPCSGSG